MRIIKQLTNNKFLNLKEVCDPEYHVKAYQFAERRGVDSIAFICYDENSEQFLINCEYKPPTNQFIDGAFGGSLDKNVDKIQIVLDEIREEAGFDIDKEYVYFLGKVFVSTQMNQYCHLYIIEVDRNKQLERKPENLVEAMAKTKWIGWDDIGKLEDWKAITILAKAKSQGIL